MKDKLGGSQLRSDRHASAPQETTVLAIKSQESLFKEERREGDHKPQEQFESAGYSAEKSGIDYWTDIVIQHGFDDLTLGQVFNRVLEETRSADSVIAFAAIIAKAKLARERRRRG